MAQSSFDMIRDDPEVVIAYYQEKIEELEEAIAQNDSGSVKMRKDRNGIWNSASNSFRTGKRWKTSSISASWALMRFLSMKPCLQKRFFHQQTAAGKRFGPVFQQTGAFAVDQTRPHPQENRRPEYLFCNCNSSHKYLGGALGHGPVHLS